ncbi:MAG: hypothetical protein Q8O24_05360 [Gallionellaceae bacterium]|nr:hypothetical protein [Gallionellaceae bacterium]
MSANNSDVNSDVWFTVEQLAEMGLPGYPRTGRNWHNRAKAEAWKSREVASQGRTGYRTEYTPPPEVTVLIEARQRGELPPAATVRQPVAPRVAPPTAHQSELDPASLRMALIITDDAAAAQPMTIEQRADMALSVYIRLSKKE